MISNRVTFIERIKKINKHKFSFGKNNEFANSFNLQVGALSMNIPNFGLDIPSTIPLESQLYGVFHQINNYQGVYLFNISAVDLNASKKGFINFGDAYDKNMITEWELSIILENSDYYKNTIFHNGKVELKLTNNGIKIKWR